ncbi:MAG: acetyl-CoA carboxylase biotin carboxyl carrier protein [Pirellulaceae bacterium]|nr:acetyl-CoA carboxylase biotin carboxyl carrier protein [Pirellulaceae bacterium]
MTDSNPSPSEVFDVENIQKLIELMKEHDLSEINLKHDGQRIRLRRGGAEVTVVPQQYPPMPSAYPPPVAPLPSAAPTPETTTPQTGTAPAKDEENPNIKIVTSPMVGTFYSRANPKAEPFAKVGTKVSDDATICIVEAMKVFNEIPAGFSGEIVAVLVQDEEPVDFGKPLFKIDTSKT